MESAKSREERENRWANLPSDIIVLISQCMDSSSLTDVPRLRAVCTSWRSALILPPSSSRAPPATQRRLHLRFPLPLPRPWFYNSGFPDGCVSLLETIFFVISPLQVEGKQVTNSMDDHYDDTDITEGKQVTNSMGDHYDDTDITKGKQVTNSMDDHYDDTDITDYLPPKKGWLIRARELEGRRNPNTWRVLNPVEGSQSLFVPEVTDTPEAVDPFSYSNIKFTSFRGEISNVLDYRINELAVSYALGVVNPSTEKVEEACWSPKAVVLDHPQYLLVVLAFFSESSLGLWTLGDEQWTKVVVLVVNETMNIKEIASHNGKFYVLEFRNKIYVIDPNAVFNNNTDYYDDDKPKMFVTSSIDAPCSGPAPVICDFNKWGTHRDGYLVNCNNKLYLVVAKMSSYHKDYYGCISIFVLQEEEEKNNWNYCLDSRKQEQVFFLSGSASFAMPVRHLNFMRMRQQGRWICFKADKRQNVCFTYYGNAMEWRNEGNSRLFITHHQHQSYFSWRTVDLRIVTFDTTGVRLSRNEYPDSVFFPPPPWVKWRCPDHGNLPLLFLGADPKRIIHDHPYV